MPSQAKESAGIPGRLGEVLDWFYSNAKGNGFSCTILNCTLAATVYWLWQERNSGIFRGVAKGQILVVEAIANGIRDFLSSRRNVKSSLENKLCCASDRFRKPGRGKGTPMDHKLTKVDDKDEFEKVRIGLPVWTIKRRVRQIAAGATTA
ncbi:hypothetical protein Vadar_014787 [Vaccinium darrowii]|uniref:Uncharacterized protein n=1 Tax=Vaccinium darrowii TaxID=229202 RepID=A0ACB7Y0R9_9ERIC|nr:hypothetical protein Vadar_014787 [Vaccinium darrowii]